MATSAVLISFLSIAKQIELKNKISNLHNQVLSGGNFLSIAKQIECSDDACVMTMIFTFTSCKASKIRLANPETPIMAGPSKVINAIWSILLIPLTT